MISTKLIRRPSRCGYEEIAQVKRIIRCEPTEIDVPHYNLAKNLSYVFE